MIKDLANQERIRPFKEFPWIGSAWLHKKGNHPVKPTSKTNVLVTVLMCYISHINTHSLSNIYNGDIVAIVNT